MKKIDSPQNTYIKTLIQLQEKPKARRLAERFIIEGEREISLAKHGQYTLTSLLFCADYIPAEQVDQYADSATEIIEISKEVYKKLAYRDTTEGLIAVAATKSLALEDLILGENPLILIAEAPEKPGNLGALLRTADAAGVDAIIIADPKTDIYNPNVVRSSVGCVFTTAIATGSSPEVIDFLTKNNIPIFAACLQESTPYQLQNYQGPTAFAVGTEATGLTQVWRSASTQNIIIPMSGQIDSMNVSVAAAILVFEAKRQRGF